MQPKCSPVSGTECLIETLVHKTLALFGIKVYGTPPVGGVKAMYSDAEKFRQVWNQTHTPIVLRSGGKGQSPRVRLPFSENNRAWLPNSRRRSPTWVARDGNWEIPKSWFNDFVQRALKRYGKLYVVQPYREQEKCAPACMNAGGHECQCSCMGANHGAGNDGSWFEVSETFATRWGDQQLACRLMKLRQ